MSVKFSDDEFRTLAKQVWENDIEFDDDNIVSRADLGEDEEPVHGAYVAAWVWVQFDEEED